MARGKSGRNARRFIKSHIADAFRSDDMEQFIGRVPEAFKMTPRRWQSSAIDRLRAGDNVMVKAGTGSGKSFLFEVMVLTKDKAVVLIVSPVKALMKRQVPAPPWQSEFILVYAFDRSWIYGSRAD